MTVAARVASAFVRTHQRRPEHTRTMTDAERRLADLENALVADIERMHDCRWRSDALAREAHDAHQRVANRRPEINRLRAELGVAP